MGKGKLYLMRKFIFDDELLKRKEFLLNNGYDAYCLNTYLSKEMDLCYELNTNYEHILVLPIRKKSYKSKDGIKEVIEKPLLSNYVFVFLPKEEHIYNIKSQNILYKVLNKTVQEGRLFGSDLEYADFILKNNGVLDISKAIKEGTKVKILSGPLKDLEAYIISYDTRNKGVKVRIHLLNRDIETYLPYELVDVRI